MLKGFKSTSFSSAKQLYYCCSWGLRLSYFMRGGRSDEFCRCQACLGKYTLLGDEENPRLSMFERQLPCFGCGIGWSCFLLGFLCPIIWYVAALLYCCKYYDRDPRERPGLAAASVLAVIFTAATITTLSVLLICCVNKRFLNSCAI